MNKKLFLVGGMTVLVLAGCQNLEDQIGAKLAEGIINTASNGEVKVSIEDLEKGKINITTKEGTINLDGTENGGKFSVTDETGKTVIEGSGDNNSMVISDSEGKTSTFTSGEGKARPAGAPSDLPSPDGAVDFNFFTYDTMSSLTYALDSADLTGNCTKIQALVEAGGWKVSKDGFNFETSDSVSKTYANSEATLNVMCGLNDNRTTIGLQKTMME